MITAEKPAKRAVNLTLSADVLDTARAMGMNISQMVDGLLAAEVARRQAEQWEAENAAAIASYNQRIEHEGTLAQRIQQHLQAQQGDAA